MFKESDFNFEKFVKESINKGVFFKNGPSAYKIVSCVFLSFLVLGAAFEYYQTGKLSISQEEKPRVIWFISFFSLLILGMWSVKDKVIFGFKDGYIVSQKLIEPYPLSSVTGYRITDVSARRFTLTVKFYIDKNAPPKYRKKFMPCYSSLTGTLHFTMFSIVTTDNIPLLTERFEKLLRRQLRAAGAKPERL